MEKYYGRKRENWQCIVAWGKGSLYVKMTRKTLEKE